MNVLELHLPCKKNGLDYEEDYFMDMIKGLLKTIWALVIVIVVFYLLVLITAWI